MLGQGPAHHLLLTPDTDEIAEEVVQPLVGLLAALLHQVTDVVLHLHTTESQILKAMHGAL